MAATSDGVADPLLELRGIGKRFPGVQALDEVDFTLRRGEIHALLGQNGAGKSTLIHILTGVHRRDTGQMRLAGRPIAPRSPQHAQELGISAVYQEVSLIPYLSVAENLSLGRQPGRWGRIAWGEVHRRARASLSRLGLDIDVGQPLQAYSVAIQQMVAIARALDVDCRVLILDEPTSSLDAREVEQLFAALRGLRARGLGIIFITHFLEQVYEIADRMTVLRNGRLVGEYETQSLPRVELVTKMLGTPLRSTPQAGRGESVTRGETARGTSPGLLEARALGRRGSLSPLDLRIDAGESVGLAGLLGSGRTEAARLFFGVDHPDSGQISIDGRRMRLGSVRQAIRRGLGFCPEDRKAHGLFPSLSLRENIILAKQARRGWLWRMSLRAQKALAEHYIGALGIATPDADRPVSQLSGGNQQKAILARWLAAEPRLLILDEPTRGIDIGAKTEIEALAQRLRSDGLAIVFISSELEEVARNCQRVAVLRDRVKIGELAGEQIDVGRIMQMIAGEA